MSPAPAARRSADATIATCSPPDAATDAEWFDVTAWQGGGLVVDRLERTGPGLYRTTEPIPVHGDWKTMIRLAQGQLADGAADLPAARRGDPGR